MKITTVSRAKLPEELRIAPGKLFRARDRDADRMFGWEREAADKATAENLARIGDLHHKLYADGRFSMLIVLQAVDGGGKDSTIRRVFTAFNPQGCNVVAFKAPTQEELAHDFLWRIHARVPRKGAITIFNRSHYEDVLVVRVDRLVPDPVWKARYDKINEFERLLGENGTRVIKLFLQISRKEQRQRFEDRLKDPAKNWKFDPADLRKREQWDPYQRAFEAAISRCTTASAPWYVVPANRKWLRNLLVSQIIVQELEQLPLRWPKPRFDAKLIKVSS